TYFRRAFAPRQLRSGDGAAPRLSSAVDLSVSPGSAHGAAAAHLTVPRRSPPGCGSYAGAARRSRRISGPTGRCTDRTLTQTLKLDRFCNLDGSS
ncbi:hypothetical protein XENOCAPTIV_024000, partial [Xenoophorus captivus]